MGSVEQQEQDCGGSCHKNFVQKAVHLLSAIYSKGCNSAIGNQLWETSDASTSSCLSSHIRKAWSMSTLQIDQRPSRNADLLSKACICSSLAGKNLLSVTLSKPSVPIRPPSDLLLWLTETVPDTAPHRFFDWGRHFPSGIFDVFTNHFSVHRSSGRSVKTYLPSIKHWSLCYQVRTKNTWTVFFFFGKLKMPQKWTHEQIQNVCERGSGTTPATVDGCHSNLNFAFCILKVRFFSKKRLNSGVWKDTLLIKLTK